MDIRKMKIRPEDEARLRELSKIHENEIDKYTDEQLDAVEKKTSEQLQRLLQKSGNSHPPHNVLRFRFPFKSGAVAFLAAAAAMLFVQMHVSDNIPSDLQVVSKGTFEDSKLSCESSVVESDGTTPEYDRTHYLVKSNKSSYLKLHCGKPVYVHIGFLKGDILYLEFSNLGISINEKIVMKGLDRVDITALAQKKSALIVLVTEQPLSKSELSKAERTGLWFEELPLALLP